MNQPNFSVQSIVSDRHVERLIFLGQVDSDAAFEMGDITNHYLDELDARREDPRYNGIGVMEVYEYFGGLTGKSARTIRYYAAVAKFYPPHVRDEFDLLRFSHFAEAMPYDQWREMLTWAARGFDPRRGLPSTEAMLYAFRPGLGKRQEAEMMAQPLPEVQPLAERMYTEAETVMQTEPGRSVPLTVSLGYQMVDQLTLLVPKLPVAEVVKSNLLGALSDLRAALAMLQKEQTVAERNGPATENGRQERRPGA